MDTVPDIIIRGIDNEMAERIKEIARLNNMPINDVLLKLLRQALKLDVETLIVANPKQDIARLLTVIRETNPKPQPAKA